MYQLRVLFNGMQKMTGKKKWLLACIFHCMEWDFGSALVFVMMVVMVLHYYELLYLLSLDSERVTLRTVLSSNGKERWRFLSLT